MALAIAGRADAIEQRLRRSDPPIIGRIADGRVLLDLRTISPREDDELRRPPCGRRSQ